MALDFMAPSAPAIKHGIGEVMRRIKAAPEATAQQDWDWLSEELDERLCGACGAALQRWETLNRQVLCTPCDMRLHPQAETADERDDRTQRERLGRCGVPPAYQSCTAATWKGKMPAQFAEFTNAPSGFWYIHGNPGRGKTHLAVAALDRLQVARGGRIFSRFCDTKETLAAARLAALAHDQGQKMDSVIRPMRDCEVLSLDDLGAERGTEFEDSVIAEVLRFRHMQQKATIVTSNLPPDELRRLMPAVASRITTGLETHLAGGDRRAAR